MVEAGLVELAQLATMLGTFITLLVSVAGAARWAGSIESDLQSMGSDLKQLRQRLTRLENNHMDP